MKKEKSWKKIILSGIVVFCVCFAGNILGKLLTPDSQEVLMYLLTKPENISLNTTEEKTNNCSYQILNGILYMMLSVKLDAPVLCRLDAPELDFACCASADCLHQHLQVI